MSYDKFIRGFCQKIELEVNYWKGVSIPNDVSDSNKTGIGPVKRLRWKREKSDLVYLFQRLVEEGFLTNDFKDKPWQQLGNHFADKDGRDLENLRQTSQNIQHTKSGKSRHGKKIDEIISETMRSRD